MRFQRFSAPDLQLLMHEIETARVSLQEAQATNDTVRALDVVGELGGMLTTARREEEARSLLLGYVQVAQANSCAEAAGWFWLALGTANQYLDHKEEANAQFSDALGLARVHEWQRLQHFVLSHWARSLVEEGQYARAKDMFNQALILREALNDPRQTSTRGALGALEALEQEAAIRAEPNGGNA
jgi:hypothetical protein